MTAEPIQWYPGHMARAMRRLAEDLRIVDVVIEAIDARLPRSGANPALDRMIARKLRLRVLTREDLADPHQNIAWLESFRKAGYTAVAIDAKGPSGATRLRQALKALAGERRGARALVLGIPNAGKSTLINLLAGRKVARTENRAGVTRAAQWFRIAGRVELMDTAGILVPKIETPEAQWKLAIIGALPQARFEPEDIVRRFEGWAQDTLGAGRVPDLETFAQQRGLVRRGNVLDTHNAAWAYIKAFNEGTFGRMTLEAAS